MEYKKLIEQVFKGDLTKYGPILKKKLRQTGNSLFKYLPLDKDTINIVLEEIQNGKSNEDIKKSRIKSTCEFNLNTLDTIFNQYSFHSSPTYFNDPFDCVFGLTTKVLEYLFVRSLFAADVLTLFDEFKTNSNKFKKVSDIRAFVDKSNINDSLKLNTIKLITYISEHNEYINSEDKIKELFLKKLNKDPRLFYNLTSKIVKSKITFKKFCNAIAENKQIHNSNNKDSDYFLLESALKLTNKRLEVIFLNNGLQEEFKVYNNLFEEKVNELNQSLSLDINSKFAVSCYTDAYDSGLMWSHYANKHYGVCIEYDFTDYIINQKDNRSFLMPVIYDNKRITIEKNSLNKAGDPRYLEKNKELINDLSIIGLTGIYSKGIIWKPEHEWRSTIITKTPNSIEENKIHVPIKSITFGYKLEKNIKNELYKLIKSRNNGKNNVIEIYEIKNKIDKYELSRSDFKVDL